MTTFQGSLQAITQDTAPVQVSIQLDNDRIRMWSDRHRIGSWDADSVVIQRDSIFRFVLTIDTESYAFMPVDPAGFAATMNVEIDLTSNGKARFGLADRLRQVAEAG